MKYPVQILFGLIAALLFCACGPNGQGREETGKKKEFFDLRAFIAAEAQNYSQKQMMVVKTLSLDDRSETLGPATVDWKKELKPLSEAHINRSAWLDRIKADTTTSDSGYTVTYRATEGNIPVKELRVGFDAKGNVESIRTRTNRKNLLYTSDQETNFLPGRRYLLTGSQRTLFLRRTEYSVEGVLVPNREE